MLMGNVNGTGRSAPTRARNDAAMSRRWSGQPRNRVGVLRDARPIAFCTRLVFAAASVASLFGLSGTMQFPFPGPHPCASAAVFQNSAGSGPSGALAFSASNRDPKVRHSLGFPADLAGSETAALSGRAQSI